MKQFKSLASCAIVSTALFANVSFGDDLLATKTPAFDLFPNAYGEFLLRHYHQTDKGEIVPETQVRYKLGSTFFSERLKSNLVFGAIKKTDSTAIEDRGTRLESEFHLVKNENFDFGPFADLRFATAQSSTRMLMGPYVNGSYKQQTAVGDLSFNASYHVGGWLGPKTYGTVQSDDGRSMGSAEFSDLSSLGLTAAANGTVTAEQAIPNMQSELIFGANLKPEAIQGLKVGIKSWTNASYAPKMVYNKNAISSKKMGKTQYPDLSSSYERWAIAGVGYEFSKGLELTNDFWLGEARYGRRQYKNIVSFTASVF
jgi:hypothetical protein